ncbi:dienelactone hydrolase family protein [Cyanobacterium aponinum AL20118]|uniref:Dienelactone hydrolase family protein n=1 Tax=Cyanobacterium aponinum AL20115 TaxID=3090662 RepID=A0AAF0Z8T6_9CHRO|nr:dienelactone hydrolase family protein [Cyanobacterium aponinum]WPF87606.1 dienelactone hydrolase family protein [Cyanobacterium aponinum AL20115]
MKLNTDTVQILNQDLLISAYLAQPDSSEELPAVIVVQEIFGVNDHIQDITRRIANEGYIAIAPAIYQRQAPNFTAGYTPEDVKIGREYKNQTKADELLSDIQATINFLYQLPRVKKTGVGAIGFCFGGHVTYLTAILPEIKATASFYGAGIANWCPGSNVPTIDRTKDIKGKIYCFFGEKDASIPPEQVTQIESELQKYQIPHQIFRYGEAEHGFMCDRRSSYHQESAQDAWEKALELFKTTL